MSTCTLASASRRAFARVVPATLFPMMMVLTMSPIRTRSLPAIPIICPVINLMMKAWNAWKSIKWTIGHPKSGEMNALSELRESQRGWREVLQQLREGAEDGEESHHLPFVRY